MIEVGQAERQPALHIVEHRKGKEAGGVNRASGKRKQGAQVITVVIVRPIAPNPEALESVYQILSASKTA